MKREAEFDVFLIFSGKDIFVFKLYFMYLVQKGGKQNHGQVQLSSFSNRRLEEKLPLGMLLEGGTKAIKRGRKIKSSLT